MILPLPEVPEIDPPPPMEAQYMVFKPGKRMVTFLPAMLGGWLKDRHHMRVGVDGQVWRYDGGVYVPSDDWVKQQVRDNHGEFYKKHAEKEVVAWLMAEVPTIGDEPPHPHLLNVANGLLDWRTGSLRPHDPDVVSVSQFPVAWDPAATCPRFEQYLEEAVPEDAHQLVWEIVGYCLQPDRTQQKAVLLLGPGGNGKTKLLDVFRGLLGPGGFSTRSLQELGENRFALADLYGKLANVCGDLPARAVENSSAFKQITGGDPVAAERKFGQPFSFTSRALLIFSANEAPSSADHSQAWFDRWVIVPMPVRFRDTPREDKQLTSKLLAELPGILVRAVEALRRLTERGHLEIPASVKQSGEAYRERVDPVIGFCLDECQVGSEMWADRADVYREFRGWCERNGRKAMAAAKFNDALQAAFPGIEQSKVGTWRWIGLALKKDPRVVGGKQGQLPSHEEVVADLAEWERELVAYRLRVIEPLETLLATNSPQADEVAAALMDMLREEGRVDGQGN